MTKPFSALAVFWLLGAVLPVHAPAWAAEKNTEGVIAALTRAVDLMQDPAFEPAREKTKAAIEKASRTDPRHQRRVLAESLSSEVVPFLTDPRTLRSVPERTRNQVDNALSDILVQVGGYPGAVLLAQSTLDRDSLNRNALNTLSKAHLGSGNHPGAVAAATRVLSAYPDDETAYTVRALAHFAAQNYLQAIEDSRKALAINKYNETALYTLKLSQNRLPTTTIALNPEYRALADEVRREYESMIQQQTEIASLGPDMRDALNARAAAQIKRGNFSGAVDTLSRLLVRNPRDSRAYMLRATAYHLLGKYDKSLEDSALSTALDPSDAGAYDVRAAALNQLGRAHQAIEAASKSLALQPQNAYAYATRARAHERLGNFPAMLADYERARLLNAQFESTYQNALATYAQTRAPASAHRREFGATPRAAAGRDMVFWLTLGVTLCGGLLIALGVWHVAWTMNGARRAARPAAPEALPAHYRALRIIGRGGMGIVYEAFDKALGRTVAIKKLRDEIKLDAKEREHFLREARTVASLRHPAIVEIYTILEPGEDLFLVFEYASGKTLNERIAQQGFLSFAETRTILSDIGSALEYAHEHQIIHRDLKPSNIMVGDDGRAKVMDFGIAHWIKNAAERSSSTNTVMGTPQYMAPEAEDGVVRRESDIYGLGVCLYEMLTSQRPFSGSALALAKRTLRYPRLTRLRPGAPPALDALIDDSLRPDPDQRIHSVGEFLRRFEDALQMPTA